MATYIELMIPKAGRAFVKVSSIERIMVPASAVDSDIVGPDDPLEIVLRDGITLHAFGKSALQIMEAMIRSAGVAFVDPPADG